MHATSQVDWTHGLMAEARRLVRRLDKRLVPRSLFKGTITKDRYLAWGTQTYFYVQQTAPNLLKSGQRLKRRGKKHAVIADLLLTKNGEENHHEKWMLSDLAALGCSKEEVERTGPGGEVLTYITAHRFHAEEGSPYAILGTALVLEYLSQYRASMAAANLIANSGIPGITDAVSFLRLHGHLDGDHVGEALSLLRGITCPRAQADILFMARFTASLIPSFFPKAMRSAR